MESPHAHNSMEFENLELYINLEEMSHISKYLTLPKIANKKRCVIYQRCACVSEKRIAKLWQDPRIGSVQMQPLWGCCIQRQMKPWAAHRVWTDLTKVPSVAGNFGGPLPAVWPCVPEVCHASSIAVRTSWGMHSAPRAVECGDFQGWVVTKWCSQHSPHVTGVSEGSFCHFKLSPTAASKAGGPMAPALMLGSPH